VYSVNCYDWERERAGDEANEYGVLWTMPLVLPLVFFFSDFFYSIAFFLFWFVLSLFLSTGFGPLFFFLLRLCLFACVSFLICFQTGRAGGVGILGGKAGALALVGQ